MHPITACGIETVSRDVPLTARAVACTLLPLAVLKLPIPCFARKCTVACTLLPLAVLKQVDIHPFDDILGVACTLLPLAVLKLVGIAVVVGIREVACTLLPLAVLKPSNCRIEPTSTVQLHAPYYRLRY